MTLPCPACRATISTDILKTGPVPVLPNAVYSTKASALAADCAPIALRQCTACSHVFNALFDSARVEYAPEGYANPLGASAIFRAYQQALADKLVSRFGLTGRAAFEVGAGDGDFLSTLVDAGMASGVGLDPSASDASHRGGAVRIAGRPLSPVDNQTADLVVMRHVLEHLDDPAALLTATALVLRRDGPAAGYFEVPNGDFALGPRGVWDVIYEHPSIFTATSLDRLLARCGFKVEALSADYDNQFLQAFVRLADEETVMPSAISIQGHEGDATRFADLFEQARSGWGAFLKSRAATGLSTAVWGAGSKGVMFCNLAGTGGETVIDLGAAKHGRFIPGTGQEIQNPDALATLTDPLIIVMNDAYLDEIKSMAKTEHVVSAMAPPPMG